METGNEFLNFSFNQRLEPITRKITLIKISLKMFEVLSLDCNKVDGFQKSEKLETMDLGETISELETFAWILSDL